MQTTNEKIEYREILVLANKPKAETQDASSNPLVLTHTFLSEYGFDVFVNGKLNGSFLTGNQQNKVEFMDRNSAPIASHIILYSKDMGRIKKEKAPERIAHRENRMFFLNSQMQISKFTLDKIAYVLDDKTRRVVNDPKSLYYEKQRDRSYVSKITCFVVGEPYVKKLQSQSQQQQQEQQKQQQSSLPNAESIYQTAASLYALVRNPTAQPKQQPRTKEPGSFRGNMVPTVYLLILTHGNIEFDPSTNKPSYVEVPDAITRFSKVTFAPFAVKVALSTADQDDIRNRITDGLKEQPQLLRQDATALVNSMKVWFNDKPGINTFIGREEEGKSDFTGDFYSILRKYQNQTWQYFTQTKQTAMPILEKEYYNDETKNQDNLIYVVAQRRGKWEVGIPIFKGGKTTTTQLLNQVVEQGGYENVVMIDFSCDSCTAKIPDDLMQSYKEQIEKGELGR